LFYTRAGGASLDRGDGQQPQLQQFSNKKRTKWRVSFLIASCAVSHSVTPLNAAAVAATLLIIITNVMCVTFFNPLCNVGVFYSENKVIKLKQSAQQQEREKGVEAEEEAAPVV
jgi:hypothetical protein